jgi:glycosyltransferase involved in cell wall biosynthesis
MRQWLHLPVVLCTARVSNSISYRPFGERIDGRPFLQWWCERFTRRQPSSTLYILAHSVQDARLIEAVVGDRARIVCGESGTNRKAFAWAANLTGAPHTAFVSYGYAFGPEDLLSKVAHHHVEHANAYTPVHGFPVGVAPEIYRTDFLVELSAFSVPGLPSEPSELAERLALVGTTRYVAFDARLAFGAKARDLPERVLIATPREMECACRVVSDGLRELCGLEGLAAWRRCAIEMSGRLERELREVVTGSTAVANTLGGGCDQDGRRRVLFVSEPAGFSGAEESLCQMIDQLDRGAFEPFALVGAEGLLAQRLRRSAVQVIAAPCGFGARDLHAFLYFLHTLKTIRPDVVHFNAPVDAPVVHATASTRIPIIAHCRNSLLTGDLDLVRMASRIIAVSEFMRDRVLALEVPPEKVRVIYDEVDPDVFRPGAYERRAVRDEYGIPLGAKVAAMVARFVPNKRHDLLLEAAFQLKASLPDLHVVLKGDVFHASETYDRVLEYLDAHAMRPWVTLLPFVDDIRTVYTLADALVLCSDGEALGRCVVEAMSMGMHAIVTDSGGSHEIIRHGETGTVVPAGDAAALSAALAHALTDETRTRVMGGAARRYVEDHLTASASAVHVMALYDEVTRSRTEVL